MVSPKSVYSNQSGATVKRSKINENKNKKTTIESTEISKLVRSDFGVMEKGELDENNQICFETNGAFFLLQIMQRNMFSVVLDLKDGEENLITYPYGSEFGKFLYTYFFVFFRKLEIVSIRKFILSIFSRILKNLQKNNQK